MLVLARKVEETIFIGDEIIITVTRIDKGQVKIGVQCPKEISVYRGELLTQEQRSEIARNATADHANG